MEATKVLPLTRPQEAIRELQDHLRQHIVGQDHLIKSILIALLCDGHLLVEGAPGLAKTKAIKALGSGIEGDFHRVQFTPDLLPSDVTGTDVFRPQDSSFVFQQGPIFHNLILADEINRAPAKVQSALLEAMAERQITIGRSTYQLPDLFLVMATQNPIEQEGTYPLPEAQLDRFLLHVKIDYPDSKTEKAILKLAQAEARAHQTAVASNPISQEAIFTARQEVLDIHLSDDLEEYIVQLVMATRQSVKTGDDVGKWLRYGASPRATIAFDRTARAHAWLQNRDYVSPEDIHAVAHDILRHRILLNFEAQADGIDSEHVITHIIKRVAVP